MLNSKTLLFLFILFLLSILIRIPTLNRPLSKHHEFCTAVSLRIMQIWDEAGIASYNFNPVMTYPNAADKFINNYASGSGKMLDAQGNYYYVSHPPLAYYVPYFLFQLIGVRPDVLPIQIFNLLLHFISAIGIYLIAKSLTPTLSKGEGEQRVSQTTAIAGFVFYLFAPATLWFQSNTYMSDMAVQPLFIFGVLFALQYFESRSLKHLFLLSLFVFLLTYTTWLGVFFAATLVGFGILRFRKISFLLAASLPAFLAVGLTVFQYSHIAGWNVYSEEAFGRFSERSGMQSGWRIFFLQWKNILLNYVTGYLPLLLLAFFLMLQNGVRSAKFSKAALFSALPILLLHLVLPNYSGHDFVSLYGAVFLSIVAGRGSAFFLKKGKWIFSGALAAYVLLSTAQYYFINRPGPISQRGDRYADYKDIGTAIRQNSSANEVVFLLNEKPSPEMIFYAGRNILRVANESEAVAHLQESQVAKGVLFIRTGKNTVGVAERFQ